MYDRFGPIGTVAQAKALRMIPQNLQEEPRPPSMPVDSFGPGGEGPGGGPPHPIPGGAQEVNAAAKGDMAGPPNPIPGGGPKDQSRLPMMVPESEPLTGEIVSPREAAAASAVPQPASAMSTERNLLRQLGATLLRHGSPVQQINGLQLIMQASRQTPEEKAIAERERMQTVIEGMNVDDATKQNAIAMMQLGTSPEKLMDVFGFDPASRKARMAKDETALQTLMKSATSKVASNVVRKNADRAIKLIENSPRATGMLGYASSYVPWDTPAYNLGKALDTLKANIGFDRLQQMREESKTGGALGQVSNMELLFLQSVQGSLDQFQDPQVLKDTIKDVVKARGLLDEARSLIPLIDQRDPAAIQRFMDINAELAAEGDKIINRETGELNDVKPGNADIESKYGVE